MSDELSGLGRQPLEERARARAGDGAEIVDQLLLVHADAVVGDGQRAGALSASMRIARRGSSASRVGLGDRRRSGACRRRRRRWRSARAGTRPSRCRPSGPSGAEGVRDLRLEGRAWRLLRRVRAHASPPVHTLRPRRLLPLAPRIKAMPGVRAPNAHATAPLDTVEIRRRFVKGEKVARLSNWPRGAGGLRSRASIESRA